jgi:hypothetical protein
MVDGFWKLRGGRHFVMGMFGSFSTSTEDDVQLCQSYDSQFATNLIRGQMWKRNNIEEGVTYIVDGEDLSPAYDVGWRSK